MRSRALRRRREGRVRCSSPRFAEAGHEVVDARASGRTGCDAAIDFTRPDVVVANVASCLAAGVPVVIGTTGFDRATPSIWQRERPASHASTRRTSLREPC